MQMASQGRWALVETLEDRRLLSVSVLIGGRAAQGVQYIDASGVKATVKIVGPGNATVTFDGTNITQTSGPAGILVSGSSVTLSSIITTGTGLYSALHITTFGAGSVTAGAITTAGVMAAILAPHVVLTGDLTTGGWVHQIVLAGAENGTMSIGPSHIGGGLNFSAGFVNNEALTSSIRINALTVGQWTNPSGPSLSIQAPQIVKLTAAGAFNANLTVGGAVVSSLGTFTAGSLVGGTWNIAANVGYVHAGSISPGWTGFVGRSISTLNIAGAATMTLQAASIGRLASGGDLTDSSLTFTEPLAPNADDIRMLSVGGEILDSTIDAIGSIGPVIATRMVDSQLYAGVLPTLVTTHGLPSVATDLVTASNIASITLRRSGDASFVNSDIAAFTLGPVILGRVTLTNGSVPFGVAGASIRSISLSDFVTGKTVQLSPVTSTAAFNSALGAKGLGGDLAVRIV
jgi:hypothetical protein